MNIESIIALIHDSLLAINQPRFYETERGFQGQLLSELNRRIPEHFPADMSIIEQEHQKTLEKHGLKIRPDIIIHQPFSPEIHSSRQEGNLAVIELKLRAGPRKAAEDFKNLESMLNALGYPIGVFINIDHEKTQEAFIPESSRGRIIAFSVKLIDSVVQINMGAPN